MKNLVEAAIESKAGIADEYEKTIRSDASAILEAVAAELSHAELDAIIDRQGFRFSASYRTTLDILAGIAKARRTQRLAKRDE
jgi:hypothetical protein